MPCRQFLVFNALGAALWVGVRTSVGYLAGNHIGAI
jgi:membrane protein DedA with SNARE-associated domain